MNCPRCGDPHKTRDEREACVEHYLHQARIHSDLPPRVFLIHYRNDLNLSPAMDLGRIQKPILEPTDQLYDHTYEYVFQKLKNGLNSIKPMDYILALGDPASSHLAVVIAHQILQCDVNILKWDRQERRYLPVAIPYL